MSGVGLVVASIEVVSIDSVAKVSINDRGIGVGVGVGVGVGDGNVDVDGIGDDDDEGVLSGVWENKLAIITIAKVPNTMAEQAIIKQTNSLHISTNCFMIEKSYREKVELQRTHTIEELMETRITDTDNSTFEGWACFILVLGSLL